MLIFIDELLNVQGNEWFKNELGKRFLNDHGSIDTQAFESFESIYNDLIRTKLFLKNIDKRIWIEGFHFYQYIKFPELKLELISDFKEMRIAENQEDIIEYVRRIVMQLENCLNAVIQVLDAHSIIKNNPGAYTDKFNNLHGGKFGFFDNITGNPKEIKDINLPAKVFFVKQYYNIIYLGKDMIEMNTIRNKSSHRGTLSVNEKKIIENARNNFSERKAAYFKCFDSIVKNLKDLYQSTL